MDTNFCTCHVITCKHHPTNHNEGCNPCIQKNLKLKEVPECFFKLIANDTSDAKPGFQGFVDFYTEHNSK